MMATCTPEMLRSDAPGSERKLFAALKTLSDEWRVYHHVVWQSARNGRQGDGEADFVALHPRSGLLIIEVKGAGISIERGNWFTTNNDGTFPIKNPYEQAIASKHALIRFLADLGLGHVPVHHAVCFPDASDSGQLGTYGVPEITWWSPDLRGIERAVTRTHMHWSAKCRLSLAEIKKLDGLLAPTVSFSRRLVDEVGDVHTVLLRITDEQHRLFNAIQRNRRAVIQGGPGSGKTLLSIARARRLKAEGFRTLWTCYNELLAASVADQLKGDAEEVRTFHSLCIKEIRRAGIGLPEKLDATFWSEDAPALLVGAAAQNGTSFDAIVIDEGQDFEQSWIDALELLIKDTREAPLYVFADVQQLLYRRSWALDHSTFLDLQTNCRNSVPIAQRVAAIFGDQVHSSGAGGPEPVFSELVDTKRLIDRIETRVGHFIEQDGLSFRQITVFLDDDQACQSLRQRYAGPYAFTQYGKHGVAVETIHRFKGLENDVIVVGLCRGDRYSADELRRIAYVGFSRARAILLVIGDPRLKALLNW